MKIGVGYGLTLPDCCSQGSRIQRNEAFVFNSVFVFVFMLSHSEAKSEEGHGFTFGKKQKVFV